MKKKIVAIMIICVMMVSLTACGKSSAGADNESEITEYTADELGELIDETNDMFDSETEYLTDEEKYTGEGIDIFDTCAEETGYPIDKQILVRGVKKQFRGGITVSSTDGEQNIFCSFSDAPNSNTGLFVPDGETIAVQGTASFNGAIKDIEIISPSNISIEYTPTDIGVVFDSIKTDITSVNAVVYGEIHNTMTLDELKDAFPDQIDYNSTFMLDDVARIDGDDGGTIYFTYDKDTIGELKAGDKVAIQGDVYSLIGSKDIDGTFVVAVGYISAVYDCYNFSTENKVE